MKVLILNEKYEHLFFSIREIIIKIFIYINNEKFII